VIRQGDLYWIDLDAPHGSEPGYRHPHIVVQNNVFNAVPIQWLRRAAIPIRRDALGVIRVPPAGDNTRVPVTVNQLFEEREDITLVQWQMATYGGSGCSAMIIHHVHPVST
jgi:hypothetical protein